MILFVVVSTLAGGSSPAFAKKKTREKTSGVQKIELSREQIRKLQEQAESGDKGLKARKKLSGYYFSNKEYKKVIDYLSPVAEGLDRESLGWLTTSYRQDKNYLNEIRVLEQWLSRQENDYIILKTLGDAYKAIDKIEDATKLYQMSIAANKKYIPAYQALLDAYADQGNFGDARVLVTELISQLGEKPEYLHKLCEYYFSDGYLKESRSYCQKAVSRDPKFADSHVILGMTYKEEEKKDRYEKVLRTAAKQFPRSELAQFKAGEMSEDLKDMASAYKFYKQATIADRESIRSWIKMGFTGVALKKYEDALGAFVKACAFDRSGAMDPFRTALAELRKYGLNSWYEKYDAAIQKCKYDPQIVSTRKVKEFKKGGYVEAPILTSPAPIVPPVVPIPAPVVDPVVTPPLEATPEPPTGT
ncbi:MAG: hypothetical protein SGJ18_14365 [Pseudomonadota bacterium]|nr:hypothetical protein [Pseudomonadota bacterium]